MSSLKGIFVYRDVPTTIKFINNHYRKFLKFICVINVKKVSLFLKKQKLFNQFKKLLFPHYEFMYFRKFSFLLCSNLDLIH